MNRIRLGTSQHYQLYATKRKTRPWQVRKLPMTKVEKNWETTVDQGVYRLCSEKIVVRLWNTKEKWKNNGNEKKKNWKQENVIWMGDKWKTFYS